MNAQSKGSLYPNALCVACMGGYYEVVKLLIDHGADVNYEGDWGRTLLEIAKSKGREDILGLLIEHGARWDVITPEVKSSPDTR